MQNEVFLRPISSQAAAGFYAAGSQEFSLCDVLVAAFATTTPKSTIVSTSGGFYDGQSTERLTCYIDELGHRDLPEGCGFKWQAGAPTLACRAF